MNEIKKQQIKKIFQTDLHFYWKAYYKNGKILNQINQDENGKITEGLYKEVFQFPERFKKFELISIEDENIKFSVDLETGDFNLKGIEIKNNIDLAGNQIKCIYWRNKSCTLNLENSIQSMQFKHYILGWQANIANQNIKREYKIFSDYSVQECFNKNNQKILARISIKK